MTAGSTIKSKAGFSFAELLMTLLIAGIILIGMTTGIAGIRRSYGKIVRKSNAMVLASSLSTVICADLRNASDVKTATDGTVETFFSGKRNAVMSFGSEEENGQSFLTAEIKGNGGESVPVPLVTKSMYPDKLTAELTKPPVFKADTDGSETGWFEFELTVSDSAGRDESFLVRQKFSVRPIAARDG